MTWALVSFNLRGQCTKSAFSVHRLGFTEYAVVRLPLLGMAACRRLVSAAAAYFDHELSIEFIRDADVSQSGLHLVFVSMGSPPQPKKRFWRLLTDATWKHQSMWTWHIRTASFVYSPRPPRWRRFVQRLIGLWNRVLLHATMGPS